MYKNPQFHRFIAEKMDKMQIVVDCNW